MSLSILVFTRGDVFAARFLGEFKELAKRLDALYVIAGDGEQGARLAHKFADVIFRVDANGLQETQIANVAKQIPTDWTLKFDDDETVSDAMRDWLLTREWLSGQDKVFSFPYAWLWGDENHFITSSPFWTDPHARLMPTKYFYDWGTNVHASNPHGEGKIIPVAHKHHKFLVKDFDERRQVAKRYDGFMQGAGTGEHYGKFTLPELYCDKLTVREVGRGDVRLQEWIATGETCIPKLGTDSTTTGKSGWAHSRESQQAE